MPPNLKGEIEMVRPFRVIGLMFFWSGVCYRTQEEFFRLLTEIPLNHDYNHTSVTTEQEEISLRSI